MAHIGLDLDDVLKQFMPSLLGFINETYGTDFTLFDCTNYNVWEFMGLSREEVIYRVNQYYVSPDFMRTKPVYGAVDAVERLAEQGHRLSIITSRPENIRGRTMEWLTRHYPPVFESLHFANSYMVGAKENKSTICRRIGVDIFVDDTLHHTADCAENGIPAILFDNDSQYKWNQGPAAPGVTRIATWDRIVRHIN